MARPWRRSFLRQCKRGRLPLYILHIIEICQTTPRGELLLGGGWIYQAADGGDAIGWEAGALGVFADGGLIGREVNAVHFISGDVAVQPLNFGAHGFQHADGFLSGFAELRVSEIPCSGDFAFDDEFRHGGMLALLCSGSNTGDRARPGVSHKVR